MFFSYLKIIRISVSQIMYFCFEVDENKGVKVKVEQCQFYLFIPEPSLTVFVYILA